MTSHPVLSDLLPSWLVHLRAERKSPATLESYEHGVRRFLHWCDSSGHLAVLDRPTVNAFVADLLAAGLSANTAIARQRALKQFARWLVEEDEIDRNELLGLKPPRADVAAVGRLTDEQMKALLAACAGRSFIDRRDEALLRLMLETTARAGEALALETADIDLTRGVALIRRGKGGKGRFVPFGSQTGRSLDRYARMRRAHPLADTPPFFLGGGGQGFGYTALHKALGKRAAAAGVEGFHPHLTRHTAAQRWLSAKGSEAGLMAVAGWSQRSMLDRYTRATAAERAAEEARGLNLGDI